MASETPLNATMEGYKAIDRPLLIARNIIETSANVWAKLGRAFLPPDASDANYPNTNFYDRQRATQWRANAANGLWYVLIDMGVGGATADCFILEGHDGVLNGVDVRVRVGDTLDGFSQLTPPIFTLVPDTAMDAQRFVYLSGNSYQGRYWEIRFNDPVAFLPRARQIWLGVQLQLRHKSRVPYDELERVSDFVDVVARSGARTRVGYYHDLQRRNLEVWMDDLQVITNVRTAYGDTSGWREPLWYTEDPGTDEEATAVFGYMEETGLALPSQFELDRIWENSIVEQGPPID